MPAEPLVRTSYVDPDSDLPRGGSTARSESETDLERLVRPLERMHAGHAHGSGVAHGLLVVGSIGDDQVTVSPGIAIDAAGRHLSLAAGALARVDDAIVAVGQDGVVVSATGQSASRDLTIAFAETFDVDAFEQSGATVVQFDHTPQLALVDPDDVGTAVVLATVTLDDDGLVVDVAPGRRRVVSAPVGQVDLRRSVTVRDDDARTVVDRPTAELRAHPDGGAHLRMFAGADRVAIDRDGAAFAELSVTADRVVARGAGDDAGLTFDGAQTLLGVGTDAPKAGLHVSGTGGAGVILAERDGKGLSVNPNLGGRGAVARITTMANSAMDLELATNERAHLRVTLAGRVGVGTSAPKAKLHVAADDAERPAVLAEKMVGRGSSVVVRTANGTGVSVESDNGFGICSVSDTGTAGFFQGGAFGLIASSRDDSGIAARFSGKVEVLGTLSKQGGQFKIDHPVDPENRYLCHAFVESDEMKNVYDGIAELDADGRAEVTMPEWFAALNERFRYQLTPIGAAAPTLHVADELDEDGRFVVAGGDSGLRVSWQVTGVRRDPFALANPLEVEPEKPEVEKGFYMTPELYDQPAERALEWAYKPRDMRLLASQQERLHRDAAMRAAAVAEEDEQ